MAEATFTIPVTATVSIEGSSVTVKVLESLLTVKIEGLEAGPGKRLHLGRGKTMFDLVLDAARAYVRDTGESEFSAADLYHIALAEHPELELRRNSWGSHIVASAANHPSYRHYTSRHRYLRYLGKGRYSLEPGLLSPQNEPNENGTRK